MKEQLANSLKLRGEYRLRVVGPDGKVKQEQTVSNIIVKAGRTAIASHLADASPSPTTLLLGYIAVGTNATAPADADTQLGTENARKAVSSRVNSDDVVAVSTIFNAGDIPNSTLSEVGLTIEGTATANTGTLLSHAAINVTITALDSLFVDFRITLSDA